MLLMGDEVRRSQGGNNNAWCQDNPLGWMHWLPDQEDLDMRQYLQGLIWLRRQLAPLLNPDIPHLEGKGQGPVSPGMIVREWHGVQLGHPDWANWSHTLAWSLNCEERGALLWCGMNAYHDSLSFQVPQGRSQWHRVVDTNESRVSNTGLEIGIQASPTVKVHGRSLMLLIQENEMRESGLG
jgi:glycogen operon protein